MKFQYLILFLAIINGCDTANEFSMSEARLIKDSNKLDLSLDQLLFTWPTSGKDTILSHQILVAHDRDLLKKDIGDVWDSGRRFTQDSFVSYDGPPMPSGKKLWWKIKAWNQDNEESPFTLPQGLRVPTKDSTHRFALLGGTLIADLDRYPFLEAAILRHWPLQPPTFRNIGWPADDVFGLARSQFGSAQNTRSWQPPTAEEGFGSKVLLEHIVEAAPHTIIIGYGPEMAYHDDRVLFESGYKRLLDVVDSLDIQAILLSPPKQEKTISSIDTDQRNQRLKLITEFIREQAANRGYVFINLFERLVEDPVSKIYTENGVQLNAKGHRKLADIILAELNMDAKENFNLKIDAKGRIIHSDNVVVRDWSKTVRGVKFDLQTKALNSVGRFDLAAPFAIYVDGKFRKKGEEDFALTIIQDSILAHQLTQTIIAKNKLHRYQLRPLNEAYIYLFRRHEMGHLAYEMEDFRRLVLEKEKEIARLLHSPRHLIEIELIRPWSPPKDYPEDEVPAFVPEPDPFIELQSFMIPDGFTVNLFAADPMIANPINLNWDTRGRAWVATSSTYPHIVPGREPNDRIVILEDTDQDGQADSHIVFAEGLLVPHSVMPVEGGAYVTSTTELLFLADTNGDDRADVRRIIFAGFGNADVHHMIHGLRWAPWGDLYFTQSIYINTFVETSYGIRQLNGSGIWQFRPETEKLEVFSRGLINPWGHAFDQWGQAFATDGAAASGISYVFPESAHQTAVGAEKVLDGLNSGTPKNTAAEILYSRHLPDSWQGSIVTNDFRANRTVRYVITPFSSGYKSQEVQTILHSSHRSYRPVDTKIGPDGAIYIVDWYNPIIDHGEVDFHHPIRDKSHGRIWRMTQKDVPVLQAPQIYQASISKLLNNLKSTEQLTRLLANRELAARKCPQKNIKDWFESLPPNAPDYEQYMLEALWLHAALNYLDQELLRDVINARQANVRAAGVRMIAHYEIQQQWIDLLGKLANDPHPQVRLEVIHALRNLGTLEGVEMAMQVLDHPMDANLEFATWLLAKELRHIWLPSLLSGEPVFLNDMNKQMFALLACDEKVVAKPIMDLIKKTELADSLREEAWQKLARLGDAKALGLVLEEAMQNGKPALLASLAKAPAANKAVPGNLEHLDAALNHDSLVYRLNAIHLVGRWQAHRFEASILAIAKNAAISAQERMAANKALVKLNELPSVIQLAKSARDKSVRTTSLAVWAEEKASEAVPYVVAHLADLDSLADAELLFITYRQMEHGPAILTKALHGKQISEAVASRGLRVAQSSGLNLSKLEEAIRTAGSLAPIGTQMTPEERQALLQDAMTSGTSYRGQQVYRRPQLLCATCHQINGIGGLIGPDLSSIGTYMTPNSILESLLNPSSDIKQGYETVIATKKDGQVVSGTLYRKTDSASLIRISSGEIISIPAVELEKLDVSPVSLMPAGLTASLHRDELKDLVHYLINLGVEE